MNDYVVAPNGARTNTPSIVLIMHLSGVDASMRAAADQFADAGFAVAIPDLYASFDAPPPDSGADNATYLSYAKQLTTAGIDEDIDRAITQLRSEFPQTKMGIVGFCMGGRIAMVRSSGYSKKFGAVATWYGFADQIDPQSVDVPIIGSYGGADVHIPSDAVKSFFARLRVDHDVKVYPGAAHGFFHNEAAYDAEAARDSFARTVAFLNWYLT